MNNLETAGEILARLLNNMLLWIADHKQLDCIPQYHNIRSINKIMVFLEKYAPEYSKFYYFVFILLRQDLFGDMSEY